MKSLRLFAAGLLFTLTPAANAQVPPEKALATFTVTDPALELTLWASEPLFVNPTCIDIDHKGRVWVCESVNYRNKLMRKPRLNRPEGDRIVILEDTKGTGRADKATTFYQAPDFLAPLGIAVAKDPVGPGYKVYVCHSPDILLFEDKDGDGKADGPPKKLLTGFNGYDHDHGVHGILIGPDGKLYFSVGDQGVRGLQSSDGKGRKWTSNQTDCRAGTIWRCDLDGKNLELLAHNFRNEYEPCVDSFGTIFVSDNDDDGNQQTRICYVMPGGDYGYHPRGKGQTHWHEEQPGVVPKILRTYFGSPTGMCVYEGTLLPKKYWGQPLHTDAGPRHVRCYHMKPDGAGYAVERNDIVTSTDNWFRPSDVCVAPDGSVFISDWYDPGVGGHGMGDTTRGRIYRLAPKGNKPSVPKVDLDNADGFLAALGSPNLAVRYMAIAKFRGLSIQRPEDQRLIEGIFAAWKIGSDSIIRARLAWQLAGQVPFANYALSGDQVGWGFAFTLVDPDVRLRIHALRVASELIRRKLLPLRKDEPATLAYFAAGRRTYDPSIMECRELLLALRDEEPEAAKPEIYQFAKRYDGHDRFYLEAIGIAVGHHDAKRREIILADFEKHFAEWDDKTLDLIWELRPPQVLPKLARRLGDKATPAARQARIVDILAASNDAAGGRALLAALEKDLPGEARDRAFAHLQLFLPGKWRSLRDSADLKEIIQRLLSRPASRATGLALIGAAEKADAVGQVAAIAQGANEEPALRSSAVRTLGQLATEPAIDALAAVLKTGPPALRVEAAQALGRSAKAPAVRVLQDALVAKGQEPAVRSAAASALAGNRQGAAWLLEALANKQIPAEVVPEVGRLLRNSPFQGLRNKALIAFPPPARLDPKRLPDIAALARRRGDVQHGREVVANHKDLRCMACHTIRGEGGNVGPDLSAIGKKASRENLFESILYPSRAIADQYVNWIIETKDGVSLVGLIVEDTPEYLILRDANAKDTKVLKKDVESRAKNPVSLMPSDLLAYMTEEDLVDVVEYLLTLQAEGK